MKKVRGKGADPWPRDQEVRSNGDGDKTRWTDPSQLQTRQSGMVKGGG